MIFACSGTQGIDTKNRKCATCSEYKNCRGSFTSWIFFIIGLVATIALRVVTILVDIDPIYGKAAWYIGVFGFFIFFIYKFRVESARAQTISKQELIRKLNQRSGITEGDFDLLSNILCGLSSNKDRINYVVIFGTSIIAIILAIYFDFMR